MFTVSCFLRPLVRRWDHGKDWEEHRLKGWLYTSLFLFFPSIGAFLTFIIFYFYFFVLLCSDGAGWFYLIPFSLGIAWREGVLWWSTSCTTYIGRVQRRLDYVSLSFTPFWVSSYEEKRSWALCLFFLPKNQFLFPFSFLFLTCGPFLALTLFLSFICSLLCHCFLSICMVLFFCVRLLFPISLLSFGSSVRNEGSSASIALAVLLVVFVYVSVSCLPRLSDTPSLYTPY